MDQQPKIPTLKDAQKPQVKIKGMGAGLTLFDRLKQFKKKDLAFILAGLGTLFMAPLAEHFMMAPENGDAALQQGWGKGGGAGNLFGGGSSPYENGNNNIASGGAIGGSGDIITPLNVRDPSALVMGPGGTQQPNAGSAVPSTPPPTAPARSETDYKDALAGAASRAASAAVKRAPLPVPKIAVGGSGLRGLGVAGGGTSASGSLGPIGPAAGSTGGGGGSGLNLVRNAPGFRSAAGARSPTGGTGLDGTKKAGQNAGDAFSRTGSALSGLNAAASEQIPTGGQGYGGGGAGGAGANDKPYSGSGPGGSKSVGESLAFLEAKQRMEENLKLEFEKRKLKDPELLLYGIRNDSLKAIAQEMTKSLSGMITGFMDPSKSAAMLNCGGIKVPKSTANSQKCSGSDGKGGAATDTACYKIGGDGSYTFIPATGAPIVCTGGSATDAVGAPKTEGGGVDQVAAVRNLSETCNAFGSTTGTANSIDKYVTTKMKPAAQGADTGRVILEGGAPSCGGNAIPPDIDAKTNAVELVAAAKSALSSAVPAEGAPAPADGSPASKGGVLQQMAALVEKGDDAEAVKALAKSFATAEASLTEAKRYVAAAQKAVGTSLVAPDKKTDNDNVNIDSGVTTRVTAIQNSQAAVTAQATSISTKIAELEEKIKAARRDIGDEKGTGSLHDTVRLNKSSPAVKAEAEAKAKLDSITASGPESVKSLLDTAAKHLGEANDMLPLKKDDEGAKSKFTTARTTADSDLTAVRTEEAKVIKGYIDYVDAFAVTKILR